MTSTPKVTLLQLPPSSDANSVERGIYWEKTFEENMEWEPWIRTLIGNLEWEPREKPPNLMKEIEEENRGTNEYIQAL